jgi:Spy/CpxP family protein refolding chaperone
MKRTLITVALILGCATALLAQSPPPPPQQGGPAGFGCPTGGPPPEVALREALGLSDEQVAALHTLLEARRQAMEALQPQVAEAERALREAIADSEPDPTTIGTLTLQLEQLRAQVRDVDTAFRDGFLALLTEEQAARLEQIRATEGALRAAQALHQLGI